MRGVLDMLWLWLLRTAALSLWSSRDMPDTTLILEWGRCCEDWEEAVGGGMGDGSRELFAVIPPERPGCVELLLWREAVVVRASLGLSSERDSRGPLLATGPLEPWSLFLRSAVGLLAIPGGEVWGVKGRGAWLSHEAGP